MKVTNKICQHIINAQRIEEEAVVFTSRPFSYTYSSIVEILKFNDEFSKIKFETVEPCFFIVTKKKKFDC